MKYNAQARHPVADKQAESNCNYTDTYLPFRRCQMQWSLARVVLNVEIDAHLQELATAFHKPTKAAHVKRCPTFRHHVSIHHYRVLQSKLKISFIKD
jgi:hypothetical protein